VSPTFMPNHPLALLFRQCLNYRNRHNLTPHSDPNWHLTLRRVLRINVSLGVLFGRVRVPYHPPVFSIYELRLGVGPALCVDGGKGLGAGDVPGVGRRVVFCGREVRADRGNVDVDAEAGVSEWSSGDWEPTYTWLPVLTPPALRLVLEPVKCEYGPTDYVEFGSLLDVVGGEEKAVLLRVSGDEKRGLVLWRGLIVVVDFEGGESAIYCERCVRYLIIWCVKSIPGSGSIDWHEVINFLTKDCTDDVKNTRRNIIPNSMYSHGCFS
jgi:hypothetical protein